MDYNCTASNHTLTNSSCTALLGIGSRPPPFPRNPNVCQSSICYICYGYAIPVLNSFGMLGNAFSLAVLLRPRLKSSTSVFLATLCIFDLLLLVSTGFIYPSFGHCVYMTPFCLFAHKAIMVAYPVSLIARSGSVWTCVAISIDQLIGVRYPFHARRLCSSRKAYVECLFIFLFAVLYNLPAFFELRFSSQHQRILPTALRLDQHYIKYYKWMTKLLLMGFLPFAFMSIMSCLVVHALHQSRINRMRMRACQAPRPSRASFQLLPQQLPNGLVLATAATNSASTPTRPQPMPSRRSSNSNQFQVTTIAVVTVVLFVLSSSLSSLVLDLIEAVNSRIVVENWFTNLVYIANSLIIVNSSTHIITYYAIGRKFRHESQKVLMCSAPSSSKRSSRRQSQTDLRMMTSAAAAGGAAATVGAVNNQKMTANQRLLLNETAFYLRDGASSAPNEGFLSVSPIINAPSTAAAEKLQHLSSYASIEYCFYPDNFSNKFAVYTYDL